jgi:hypothetical protein
MFLERWDECLAAIRAAVAADESARASGKLRRIRRKQPEIPAMRPTRVEIS